MSFDSKETTGRGDRRHACGDRCYCSCACPKDAYVSVGRARRALDEVSTWLAVDTNLYQVSHRRLRGSAYDEG